MKTKPCPLCKGDGKVKIADYVDRQVVPDLRIKCPVCDGLKVIESADDNQSKAMAGARLFGIGGVAEQSIKVSNDMRCEIISSRENADVNPL